MRKNKIRKTELSKIICWLIWLVLIIYWNFYYPKAKPHEDVIVSVTLSIFLVFLNKFVYKLLKEKN